MLPAHSTPTKAGVMRRSLLILPILALFVILASGCNLMNSRLSSATPEPQSTVMPNDGTKPSITIEKPGNGAQGVVNQPLTVQVHAKDAYGVTRIVMSNEVDRVISQQPSPDPSMDLVALLTYTPANVGITKLQVIAYRQNIASDPVSITVKIVKTASELTGISAIDPTTGAVADAACTGRINISTLNLRTGPGASYNTQGQLEVGETVKIIGRNLDSSWYQIRRGTNNAIGWIAAQYVKTTGDCSKAPVVPVP